MAERQPGSPRGRDDSPERHARESMWLLQVAQGGPQGLQALKQLCDAYDRTMLSFFRYHGVGEQEAEDVLQEVWVRVAKHAGSFDPSQRPSTWIWTIARRLRADAVRRPWWRRVDRLGDDLEATLVAQGRGTAPDPVPAQWSLDDCVSRGLQGYARVDDEGALAVRLRDLEDMGIAELAALLHRTEGATRSFLSQVRKKLRPFLEPCFELLSN